VVDILSALRTIAVQLSEADSVAACEHLVAVLTKYSMSMVVCECGLAAMASLCRSSPDHEKSCPKDNLVNNIQKLTDSGAWAGKLA
jgi:hypothetical protein